MFEKRTDIFAAFTQRRNMDHKCIYAVEEINAKYKEAAEGPLKGVFQYSEEPLVLKDIVGNPHSCILDGLTTMVNGGNFVKVVGWYDNEWGYSCRSVDAMDMLAASL